MGRLLRAAVCVSLFLASTPAAFGETVRPAQIAWQVPTTDAPRLDTRGAKLPPTLDPAWTTPPASPRATRRHAKRWQFTAAAYLWAADIHGDLWTNSESTEIDIRFRDLFDTLDRALMGYVEARRGRWSLSLDAMNLKYSDTRRGPNVGGLQLDYSVSRTTLDLNVGYALMDRTLGASRWGRCCERRRMTLDALVGVRYWDLDADVEVQGAGGGAIVTTGEQIRWADPYLGVRWRYPWARRWALAAYADYGGFELGESANQTYKLQALVRFRLSRGWFVGLGYRLLSIDLQRGRFPNLEGIRATYHGPFLGIGLQF